MTERVEGPITVVLVDDDEAYVTTASELLERADDRLRVRQATSVEEARSLIDDDDVDCVVSDYRLPSMDGLAFRDELREDHPRLPFVLLTGKASGDVAAGAIDADRSDYVEKGSSNQYVVLAQRIVSFVARNRAERDARAKEDRIDTILDRLSDGFYALDDEWRLTYANEQALDRLGVTRDDVIGEDVWEQFPDTVDSPFYDAFHEAMATQEPVTCEATLGFRGTRIRARVFPDADGLSVYTRDVTDEYERERARLLFERIIDEAGVGLASYDASGRFRFANDRFESLVGYDVDGTDAVDVWDVFPDVPEDGFDAYWATFEEGEQRTIETDVERADGTRFPCRRITNRATVDGTEYHLVSLWERTLHEEREQQLAVLYRILRHNLRNKLTVIHGYADDLQDADDPTVVERGRTIDRSASDLLSLADSARTIDRLVESDLERTTVDVVDIVETVVAEVTADRPIEPVLDCPNDVRVLAGRELADAVEQLVDNACEYTDDDDPLVRVTVEPSPERDGWIDVSVADDGPGLSEMERRVLTDAEETQLRHGSGVGLWIVRWLVSRYGGELAVDDHESGGSVVTISLPSPD